jgi:hypothetical protein
VKEVKMTAMGRALWAETLKMKRTLALWLALIAPFLIVMLQFLIYYDRGQHMIREGQNAWFWFAQQTFVFWSLLMLPLFVPLETALLSGLEHGSDHWKHLFALPLPRWTVYAAKQVAGLALIGLGMLALAGLSVLAGLGLRILKPGMGFEAPIPLLRILEFAGLIYLASWLITALHTWVGMRWRSFVVAMGFGVAMTVAGTVVINTDWANLYPWTLPVFVANGFMRGGAMFPELASEVKPLAELAVGSLGGLVVAVLGCWEFTRRDVL